MSENDPAPPPPAATNIPAPRQDNEALNQSRESLGINMSFGDLWSQLSASQET